MAASNWRRWLDWGKKTRRGTSRAARRRPIRFRPELQCLEDRTVPSVTITATKVDQVVGGGTLAKPGDTIRYNIVITSTGTNDATGVIFSDTVDVHTALVGGSLHASPLAFDETFSAVGNTKLYVGTTAPAGEPAVQLSSAYGLLANDFALTDSISLTGFTQSTAHGSVTVNSDGTFTYTPNVGFSGTDSFTYTIKNSANSTLTSTGTVTINVSAPVWYVDSAAPAGGAGTSTSRFNSLASVNAANGTGDADAPGDTVYLFTGTYSASMPLETNQRLIGNGAALVVGGITLRSAGTAPTVGGTVTLATGTTVSGLNISSGASTGLAGSGGLTGVAVSQVSVTSTTGTAVNLNSVGGNFTFTNISAGTGASGPTNGIVLTSTTGSFTVTGTGAANSGGVIQHTGSHGVALTNAQNVAFNWFSIHDTGDHGIFGDGVNNFTFRDSTIFNFGNASPASGASEDAMHFESTNPANTSAGHGLTGTVIIQRDTFGPDGHFSLTPFPPLPENKGIVIRNHNDANLNMIVTGTTFSQISNDGIDADVTNGNGTLIVDGSTADGANVFSQINGRAITFGNFADNTADQTLNVIIRNNTFNLVGIGGRWIASARATVNARFVNNTMTNTTNDAIRSESDASVPVSGHPATVNAAVTGNSMGGGSIFISNHARPFRTWRSTTTRTSAGPRPASAAQGPWVYTPASM
jgi:uncharacterized repeat protein (TIGR01451 family)